MVTGEKDRTKDKQLLDPYRKGAFHKLAKHILVVDPEIIKQIHDLFVSNDETIRRFVED